MAQETSLLRRRSEMTLANRWWKGITRFSRIYPLGAAGAIALILLVLVAFTAPLITRFDPITFTNVPNQFAAPGGLHWFGTDYLGRDMYSRIVYGSRISLYVGLISVGVATAIGIVLGTASAYFGGKFDLLVQRIIDTMQGTPSLILVMMLVFVLGASLENVILAITVGFAPRMVRIVRSEALGVRESDYVMAAISIGAKTPRILGRHIIPNTLTSVFVVATGALGAAITTEASLSFLGLGIPPPTPSWGGMLQGAARMHMETSPHLVIFPGLAITVVVYAFNMFGDALRDHLDPRLRSR